MTTRQFKAGLRWSVGETPSTNVRGLMKEAEGLSARLDKRFGYEPSPFRRGRATKEKP